MLQEVNSVIAYKIWDEENLKSISTTIGEHKIAQSLIPGFHLINFDDYRWNILVVLDPENNIKILVAERNDLRFIMTEKVVLASIVSVIAVIPIIALLIWLNHSEYQHSAVL